MAIELTHDSTTGRWSFSFKRHIFVALGLLLVGSGLATLAGPWWQSILIALLGTIGVVADDKYQWLLATTQIVPGLGLLGYKHFVVDQNQTKINIDKSTFLVVNIPIDQVRYYLSNLVDDHSYKSSLNSIFHETHTHFLKPEFKFQYPPTAAAYQAFSISAARLRYFVGTHFFVFPNGLPADGDYRYCLAPHLNDDRGMVIYDAEKIAEYDKLKFQLHELTADAQRRFAEWVEHLKSLGHA